MTNITVKTPIQYLDKASGTLRDMGLMPAKIEPAPINALLDKIADLDKDKIALIARTLGQGEVFNEVVREQTSKMEIGERYQQITEGFNSIRDDSKRLVDQVADGKIDMLERGTNIWMKIARGDIADRFDKIRAIYLSVTKETKNQIEREAKILDAYRDYRGALKHAEVMALEVLKKARGEARRGQEAARRGLGEGRRIHWYRTGRASQARTRPRRAAARHARGGEALPDRQGPLRQHDDLLQHVGGHHGAADAIHFGQGTRLQPGRVLFLDQ